MQALNLKELAEQEKALRPRRRRAETVKYWTAEQLERFFKVVINPMHRAMFLVAFHRGLRATETRNLQLADVRLKDERIQINRLKGSASGEFHLCASEIRAIRAWLRVRGTEAGPLFRTRNGTGMSQQMQDRLMKRYGALAGIPRELCHTHTLKHTCGTQLLERGESLEDVQDHLGHRSIASTQEYARFTSPRRQARDKRLRDW